MFMENCRYPVKFAQIICILVMSTKPGDNLFSARSSSGWLYIWQMTNEDTWQDWWHLEGPAGH